MVRAPLASDGMSPDLPFDLDTLDLLPYGIIVLDEGGSILFYNAREEQISGRRRAEVIGRNFFTEVAPCTQVREFHGRYPEALRSGAAPISFAFSFPFPGRRREVEITLSGFAHEGRRMGLVAVRDVTQERALREHLERAERLRLAGETAAGVAHNFNNLLVAIQGSAELLLSGETDERTRRLAERIRLAAEDGATLVRRIADTCRQEPPQEHPPVTAVGDLIDSALALCEAHLLATAANGHAPSIARRVPLDLPAVHGSPSELREVLINLLRNAIDACAQGGDISIAVEREGDRIAIAVTDTGVGMDRLVRDRLFTPLFTTKGERGSGFGLASSFAIVRRHRGSIDVASTPGKGSTFTVRLPAAD